MNLPTLIVLLILLGLVALAVYNLHRGKGGCSYGEKENKCNSCTARCPLKKRQ